MCKPPVGRHGVAIPGKGPRRLLHAESTTDVTCCLNCGCSLKRVATGTAKAPNLIIGAVPEQPLDRSRYCQTECLYSHAFREGLLFDDDE